MISTELYKISNEFNITRLLNNFDSQYIFDIIEDKLDNIDYSATLLDSNIVASFEENFKMMMDQFPGDGQNIKMIREQTYIEIINILCNKFNLRFNSTDETIDIYTAAFYLYDFLVCNRNNIMINFFVSFIINNKEALYDFINTTESNVDSSVVYNRHVFDDYKYALISTKLEKVINYISNLDITLLNIFQSTYINQQIILFLDNAFADLGNFFKEQYCSILNSPEIMPIIITNIRLELQKKTGIINNDNITNIIKGE